MGEKKTPINNPYNDLRAKWIAITEDANQKLPRPAIKKVISGGRKRVNGVDPKAKRKCLFTPTFTSRTLQVEAERKKKPRLTSFSALCKHLSEGEKLSPDRFTAQTHTHTHKVLSRLRNPSEPEEMTEMDQPAEKSPVQQQRTQIKVGLNSPNKVFVV